MGQIFLGAALSPFLTQLTIHRREQIAVQLQHQGQHKHQDHVEVHNLFLTKLQKGYGKFWLKLLH